MNQLTEILSPELIDEYGINLEDPVLWNNLLSLEKLQAKKKINSLSFYKQYQNIILSKEDAVFRIEDLNKAKERGKNLHFLGEYDEKYWTFGLNTRVTGVDLAISKSDTADYTTIVTIAGLENGDKIVLDIRRGHFSASETRDRISDVNYKLRPYLIGIESVAYQQSMFEDLKEFTDMPVKPYKTGTEKYDPFIGVSGMSIDFENGKWIFPYDNRYPKTCELIDILVDEMLRYYPSKDVHTGDVLMALWIAERILRETKKSIGPSFVKFKGLYKKVIVKEGA